MAYFDKDAQFLKSNAAAMRALAGGKGHQVTYSGNDTHVGNADVRLPSLPPASTAAQRASLRGAADGVALWLAHHNPKTHQTHCPTLEGAKAIFEAAEHARVEAIGTRHMKGVGKNLEAALNQKYENYQIDAPGTADQAGISEAVRILLREQLSGAEPPKNLSMVMDLWRPWVQSRAGDLLQELQGSLDDQAQFAALSRRLIGALETDLGDSASDQDENSDNDDDQDDGGDSQSEQDGEQSAVGEDQSDGDDSQAMDDAGDAGMSEDGEMMEAEGADDGLSDGESPNPDMTGKNAGNAADRDAYNVLV